MLCHDHFHDHPVSSRVCLVFHDHVFPLSADHLHLVHLSQLHRMCLLLVWFVFAVVVAVAVSISLFPCHSIGPVRDDVC